MHITCPHCQNGVEVVEEAPLTDIDCPSCGSHFSLVIDDANGTLSGLHTNKTIGRFQLVNEVGVGAFGRVWRGNDPQLDRTVAVKIPRNGQLNKEETQQFFREARAAAQLKHPNIVSVHEIGKDGDTIYIVSDFVQGVSLADRLTAGPMGMQASAELCIKICRALQHAHENGVIHRDLKPGNIMLDEHGEPHVMDFGLAKRDAGEITMTMQGQILGTPAYMSPEQANGDAHRADRTSDVYSMGVILFQLLVGELPFRGNTRMMIHQVIHDEPPSLLKLNPNISKDLETIVLKCMSKIPTRRYLAANDLGDDLERFLKHEPIYARPIGNFERMLRWCKRKPTLVLAITATTLLLLTLSVGGPILAIGQSILKQKADKSRDEANDSKDQANKALAESELLRSQIQTFLLRHPDDPEVGQVIRDWQEYETSQLTKLDDKNSERAKAQSLENLAKLSMKKNGSNDEVMALERVKNYLDRALIIRKSLLEKSRDSDFLKRELAATFRLLADVYLSENDFQPASEQLREMLVIFDTSPSSFSTEILIAIDDLLALPFGVDQTYYNSLVARKHELTMALSSSEKQAGLKGLAMELANQRTLSHFSDQDGSNASFKKSHEIFKSLANEFPSRQSQLDLAYSFGLQGDESNDSGDALSAISSYKSEIAILERVELSPAESQRLSDAFVRIGDKLVDEQRIDEASKFFQRDLELWLELDSTTSNPSTKKHIAFANGKLAGTAQHGQQFSIATRYLKTGIEILSEINGQDKLNKSEAATLAQFKTELNFCEEQIRKDAEATESKAEFDF